MLAQNKLTPGGLSTISQLVHWLTKSAATATRATTMLIGEETNESESESENIERRRSRWPLVALRESRRQQGGQFTGCIRHSAASATQTNATECDELVRKSRTAHTPTRTNRPDQMTTTTTIANESNRNSEEGRVRCKTGRVSTQSIRPSRELLATSVGECWPTSDSSNKSRSNDYLCSCSCSSGSKLACAKSKRDATRISRLIISSTTNSESRRNKKQRPKMSNWRTATMIRLIFVVWLSASKLKHWPASVANCEPLGSQTTDGLNGSLASSSQNLGDLVAIGAISLLEPTLAAGRLVDRIASPSASADENGLIIDERQQERQRPPASAATSRAQHSPGATRNNLDRIVEFLRSERLTIFCDLLTSTRDPEVRQLNEKLNSLTEQRQLTLFVPTNEAMLLMPSGLLERIKSQPEETRQFLQAHAASELVLPKPPTSLLHQSDLSPTNQQQQQQQLELVSSLGETPLRVSTVNINSQATSNLSNSSRQQQLQPNFELIVNGASVISSHSSALMESNNFNAIYAIVHVVDRSLYPPPAGSLMDKLRELAPKMANYVELAKDRQVDEALELTMAAQQQPLHTMFVPNDDAFKAVPGKLLDQLDSNRTFLVQFLRAHLVEGLYYNAMLANLNVRSATSNNNDDNHHQRQQQQRKILFSLSGKELEIDLKSLQSRTWVLVNSIPIIEPDVMVLNGVLHLIARPVFERHLLDECGCGNQTTSRQLAFNLSSNSDHFIGSAGLRRAHPSSSSAAAAVAVGAAGSSWFNQIDRSPQNLATSASEANSVSNKVEREESQLAAGRSGQQKHRLRAQRSGSLVEQNNRDFYRPSAAPANLLLTAQQQQQQQQQQQLGSQPADSNRHDTVTVSLQQQQQRQPGSEVGSAQIIINRNDLNQLIGGANETRAPAAKIREDTSLAPAGSTNNSNRQVPSSANGWPDEQKASNVGDLFEADRYKIVLDASIRQRLRDSTASSILSTTQFAYDRPLGSTSTTTTMTIPTAIGTTQAPTTTSAPGSGRDLSTNFAENLLGITGNRRLYSLPPTPTTATLNSSNGSGSSQAPTNSLNISSWLPSGGDRDQLRGLSATNRSHRLLKFQPEDARDLPLPGTRIHSTNSNLTASMSSLSLAQMHASNSQPAYDIFGHSPSASSSSSSSSLFVSANNRPPVSKQQMLGKTVVPSSSFGGCAFYDADCKRMVTKLVRLPPIKGQQMQQQQPSLIHNRWPSATIVALGPNDTQRLTQASGESQHLDSTFGETTTQSLQGSLLASANWPSQPASTQQQQLQQRPVQPMLGGGGGISGVATLKQLPFGKLNLPRDMPFNQPLPPWSDEEHRAGSNTGSGIGPTSIGADISRIVNSQPPVVAFTGGISRVNQSASNNNLPLTMKVPQHKTSAQILLVPVKMLHESQSGGQLAANLSSPAHHLFFPPSSPSGGAHGERAQLTKVQQPAAHHSTRPNSIAFGGQQQQFHTPTPYSVSPMTTHLPPIFNQQQQNGAQQHLGRLTNFTAIENVFSVDDEQPPMSPKLPPTHLNQQQHSKSARVQVELSQIPRAPSAHRKHRLEQIQIDNNGFLGANFDLNPTSGHKQAHKVVRLHPGISQPSPDGNSFNSTAGLSKAASAIVEEPNGDISITSARLSSSPSMSNHSSTSLATLASNRAPANANFIRSLAPSATAADLHHLATEQTVDFFQNRTIAEIMDDSGLRIDGQQVTFGRFKECLAEASLLSLVSQPEGSLTIFMPTDVAFQRLIQQQALTHQRHKLQQTSGGSAIQTRSGSSMAARLLDPTRRHLIPLVARRPIESASPSNSDSISAAMSLRLLSDEPGAGAADRLNLDCSSSQVRQLLLDHLSSRLVTPKRLQVDIGISSLSGRRLLLSSVPSKKIVVVDGQPVIAATRAKNGMVYVVNKFLNLTHQVPNVMDLIESQPNLTTFLSYLSFSSLGERLKREPGPFTILAPTNDAFDQLSSSARQLMNSDPAALRDILRGHIVEGAQFGKLISMRNKLKTMNSDQSIEAKVIKPNVYLLDNQMTSMRLVGTTGNGVVNSIDRLIVPIWLKGSKPASSLPGGGSSLSSSSFAGEILDTSANAGRNLLLPSSQVNPSNLPGITSQSVRFASNQPLSPFSSLTETDQATGNAGSVGQGNRDSSPFLRVAANLTGGHFATGEQPTSISNSRQSGNSLSSSFGEPIGFEVESQALNTNISNSISSSAATRNMQLIEKLSNLMQAKRFVSYLRRSKVGKLLKQDMNYVILVPVDEAFDKLPRQILDMLERDSDRLADLVNYHVLDTTFEYINTIPDGQTLNTLNEKDILFNWHRNNSVLTASGAVVMGGIQEDNIALLIVDRVLFPTPGNILNIVTDAPILSNFTSLIRSAGLEQQLALAGPYTLFAPSDFAFNQLDKRDLEFLRRDKETTRRFLLRHLSQPAVFTSSVALSNTTTSIVTLTSSASSRQSSPLRQQQQVPTMSITNSLGEDLILRQRHDYYSVNDVNLSYADVAATNGVVHVIDGFL